MEWVLTIRSDLLTPLFKAFSALGYGEFLFLFLPVGYWILNKNIFARVRLRPVLLVLSVSESGMFFRQPFPDYDHLRALLLAFFTLCALIGTVLRFDEHLIHPP